jgi:hypothetical protein
VIVYYPGPDPRITDEVFEVVRPIYQRFAIGELHQVHIARVESRAFRLGPRPHAIRAFYRGELINLYQTTDRLRLRQVARALLRSMQRHEDRQHVDRRYFQPAA